MGKKKPFDSLNPKNKAQRLNALQRIKEFEDFTNEGENLDQLHRGAEADAGEDLTSMPNETPSFSERRAIAASSISGDELKSRFFEAQSIRCSRCFDESPCNSNHNVKLNDGSQINLEDTCRGCIKIHSRESIPVDTAKLVVVEPTGTLDPITNVILVRRNSNPNEVPVLDGKSLLDNYTLLLNEMPGGNNRQLYRGEFSSYGSLCSTIESRTNVTVNGEKLLQMPHSKLTEFLTRCQWGPHCINNIVMPSIGSLSCYPLAMISFVMDVAIKLGGRLHYVYLIALGNNRLDPNNLIIVNAFKLLQCLKTKVMPNTNSRLPEHVWIHRMFKEFRAREIMPEYGRDVTDNFQELEYQSWDRFLSAQTSDVAGPSSTN